jgi:hypothetical protein
LNQKVGPEIILEVESPICQTTPDTLKINLSPFPHEVSRTPSQVSKNDIEESLITFEN